MSYAVGSLVLARGREWIVQPNSSEGLLRLKPLGAPDLEATAILPALEPVEPAQFDLPDPTVIGDTRSCRLLRDAVRLGFRASTGPFRSLAGVAVEPRPYQLVPLLMALRQNPVRLLIADDVGIGKTIEAALIAKELLARGECERLCVLCPPHLAEQWQRELSAKFGLDPVLVVPGTVAGLERQCPPGVSLFEQFPITVVSLDYIKSDRRRDDFLRGCPELVIVDEAHTCTQIGSGAQQQRYRLLKDLAKRPDRHMILVTATPHSGNDQSFRSMLSLLREEFSNLPEDLTGEQNRRHREQLAAHFVQRRRADIEHYLKEDTPFPTRTEADRTYKLHPDYRKFMETALKYAREVIQEPGATQFQQRIRWWSALAMLRSISSSPAAAVATLRARAKNADSTDAAEIELLGRLDVMDPPEDESASPADVAPGAEIEEAGSLSRRRLLDLARIAETLKGDKDRKLLGLTEEVRNLLAEGFRPIVFCKFIETAEYIADELRKRLRGAEVACVTGQLHHDERETRVAELAQAEKPVLVCTDCLSEGINLQEQFDAVVHADLAWSPTRHEQREGRVDRFNQRSPAVRVVTYFGEDNPIDGIVLNILLARHRAIRKSLGVSVPVPVNSDKVLEAIFESLLLKGSQDTTQLTLFDDADLPERKAMNVEWDRAADRERKSRTLFAQHAIRPEEVQPELDEVRQALGSPIDLERLVRDAVRAFDGRITDFPASLPPSSSSRPVTIDLSESPLALRDAVHYSKPFKAAFTPPAPKAAERLTRTHPFVEALAGYVADAALAGDPDSAAKRCGVTATDAVKEMTTILLLRFRHQIVTSRSELLAEEAAIVAFSGLPDAPHWLTEQHAETLLAAPSRANIAPGFAREYLQDVIDGFEALREPLRELGAKRAAAVLESHRRVRRALQGANAARAVRLQGDPDVLGLYILLPVGGGN